MKSSVRNIAALVIAAAAVMGVGLALSSTAITVYLPLRGEASAKQRGQAMSQALLTSMMPRQACC